MLVNDSALDIFTYIILFYQIFNLTKDAWFLTELQVTN
ncbi:hypothetical protein VRK_27330 [Vibrio sp. MEBiC08052]|nr:hypothetical protein VRK_27330 [Vibrio sp. MEBiC08052]